MSGTRLFTQADVMAWVRERWPDRCTPDARALKLGEEAGEVLGAVVKSGEGRMTAFDIAKECAQVVMCLYGLAEAVGFDLDAYVANEWDDMQVRTWPSER